MPVAEAPGVTDGSPRAHWDRRLRLVVPTMVVLLAVGAALMWGPIGLGNGPLAVSDNVGEGAPDNGETPVGFILNMYNSGGSPAVVDSVDLVGGTRYAAPRILALAVMTSARCLGAWPARATSHGFVMEGCGGQDRGRLIGRAVPTAQPNTWGFPAAAEAAAPPPGTCWVVTKVVVHYHVGIRHYAATDGYQLTVCGGGAHLGPAMNAAEGVA